MRTFLAVFAACVFCACSHNENSAGFVPTVYVTQPEGGVNGASLSFTGVVEEDDNISLGFKTAGQISRIYVKEGDHVKAGQLLASLDDADYRLGVEALQIQYDQLKDEVARAQRLFEKKSMTANDYEKASAGLRQLGVQLQVNKNKLAYTRLYAPASGVIESVNFAPAEMVDAGTAVFTMLSQGGLEVVCDIPAKTYFERDRFTSFSCRSSHSEGAEFPLRLLSIVPKADSNQLYRVRLAADGSAARVLTPGMNVEVSISLSGDAAQPMTLPASAVFRKGKETCVWVVGKDSTVKARPVVLDGSMSGAFVGISSGLTPDETVVRAGVSALHEGEKVKVAQKPSETNLGGLL